MAAWDGKTTLRFKSDPKSYEWTDEVMGKLSTGPEVVDDYIIMKSDGYPTYNFAHIIDDELMQITHVIRSQEFISSTPKFLNMYEALEIERPKLVTLPFVLGPDGKKKLSKRDGAKDILEYKDEGYLPETLLNFLATLGWNDGTTQEVFSKEELISKFDIKRVNKSGAKFDEQRLLWLNGHYIRETGTSELLEKTKDFWPKEAENFKPKGIYSYSMVGIKKKEENTLGQDLYNTVGFEKLKDSDFSVSDLTDKLNLLLHETDKKPGELFSLIRIVTTWAQSSPALAESLSVLGKAEVIKRFEVALKAI